jgi:hypothetical protein
MTDVMKKLSFTKWVIMAGVAIFVATAQAQNNANVNSTPEAAPALATSVSGVLQLSQAKVSDSTILSFIQNSSTGYPMAASQIVYLKQQGVSDAVLNAMINHPGSATTYTSAPVTTDNASVSTPNATVAPTITTYETVPSSSVYVVPDTQTYYYDGGYYGYPYPYYYAPVGVSIGFGWHGGWGGGWHGGYGGGWHGGGGHGGWHH